MLKKLSVQGLHLWCGLFAALWLAVLGGTGFMLDHRDNWRWLWQSGVSAGWLPEAIQDKAGNGSIRLYQVSPHDAGIALSGGMTGLWWRKGDEAEWQQSRFNSSSTTPLVHQILFDARLAGRVWLATGDGLWSSNDNGQHLKRLAFAGQGVTAIARYGSHRLYAVIERSRLFRIDTTTGTIGRLPLSPPPRTSLPAEISLSRFVRDLHYGRGITTVDASLLWNDIAGIALLVLPLSGILFYWLPKRWRRRKAVGADINHHYKKQTMRWLFRLHGPTLGLLSIIPLLYLALTGILLDHSTGLRQWMKQTEVSRLFQTPVYNIADWQGHIYGVAVSGAGNRISLATRLGLYSSVDDGKRWQRERVWADKAVFVWTLRQRGEQLFIGGMGSPNFVKPDRHAAWQNIGGHAHMPSDITVQGDSVLLKNRKGLWRITKDNQLRQQQVDFPAVRFIPWFYVIDGLHSGLIIHSQWKWANDLIALLAIVLAITGLLRWWKTKWI